MYYVYKHTLNGKNYIGFTGLNLEKRLKKHMNNSKNGIDTHFYRAIRKYGVEEIKSEVLYETDSFNEALEMERYFISKYDSYKNGYNMTNGGDGGDIISLLDEERYKKYIQKLSNENKGKLNKMYIDISDDDLVIHGSNLYKKNGYFSVKSWQRYAKVNKIPQSFSKFRFDGGGMKEFRIRICNFLNIKELKGYEKTNEHKKKLSESSSIKRWVSKENESLYIDEKDLEKYIKMGYSRGRRNLDILGISKKIIEEFGELTYSNWKKYMTKENKKPLNFPKGKYSIKEIKKEIEIDAKN